MILMGGGLLLIFSSSEERRAGPLGEIAYGILRPFQEAAFAVRIRVRHFRQSYLDLVGIREENQRLKEEVAGLRRDKVNLLSQEHENRRLRRLLDIKSQSEFPSLAAQVIGEDAVGWYRTFLVNRGAEDGVIPGMAVTSADGLLGRIVTTSASVSKVMLITDPGFSADCRVTRTRDRGILTGYLDRQCILRYLDLKAQVRPEDLVITSGLGGIFPRGILVGKVDLVRRDSQGLFLEALVVPAANFSEIEEAMVILGKPGGFDMRPGLEERR